jgi:transcriptional regulator with XRE-family HTH domain
MALTINPETVELGKLIKLRRELAGWSQRELAERAQMNRVTITRIESGDGTFPKLSLAKITHALGPTLAEVAQATGRSPVELRAAPIYMRDPEFSGTQATSSPAWNHSRNTIHPTWYDAAYWAEIRTLVEAA